MAIVNPLKPRMGKGTTLCIAVVIWAVSATCSLPMLFYYTTTEQNLTNGEVRIVCYQNWPDQDLAGRSYQEYL